jgi:3-hydroxyisobutyrate dehydrogenase-like beta-hydroxyacid dehydrogenase
VDHTTTHPAQARACARFADSRGAVFVDAPMSGGKAGAQAGELTLFVGAAQAHLARLREISQAYSAHVAHMGAIGAGQATKLAHQLAITGTVLGLAAALEYGKPQGLDATQLLAALKQGTARSIQLTQHAEKMSGADFDFAASFAWLAKDLAALPDDAAGLSATLCALLTLAGKDGATGAQ